MHDLTSLYNKMNSDYCPLFRITEFCKNQDLDCFSAFKIVTWAFVAIISFGKVTPEQREKAEKLGVAAYSWDEFLRCGRECNLLDVNGQDKITKGRARERSKT